MNASTRTNNTLSNLKSLLRKAVASRAFGICFAIACFIALCYAFSLVANACVLVFGETLGLIVYLVICFIAIFAVEAFEKRARAKLFVASIRR